jgi:hypothetical protein
MTQLLPLHEPTGQLQQLANATTIRALYLWFNSGTGRFYACNLQNLSDSADISTTATAGCNGSSSSPSSSAPFASDVPTAATAAAAAAAAVTLPHPRNRSAAANTARRQFARAFGDALPPAVRDSLPQPGHKRYRRPLHTIEFRQHAATLDAGHVTAWARVLCGTVRFAHEWAAANAAAAAAARPTTASTTTTTTTTTTITKPPFPSVNQTSVGAAAPMLEHVLRSVPLERQPSAHDVLSGMGLGAVLQSLAPMHPDTLPPQSDVLPTIMCSLPRVSERLRAAAAANATFTDIASLTSAPSSSFSSVTATAVPANLTPHIWAYATAPLYTGRRPVPPKPARGDWDWGDDSSQGSSSDNDGARSDEGVLALS